MLTNKTNGWYAEIKHFACYLYPKISQLTSLSSEKYENIKDGFKMQNNEFWRQYWRFIDVSNSKVISIAEHDLILKKIQVEERVSASYPIFRIDINGVKCFKS